MTIVIDASAFAHLYEPSSLMPVVVGALRDDPDWAAPEHLRLEVASALRGRFLGGHLTQAQFETALRDLARAQIESMPTAPLLPRIAELAPNATTYDAAYVALAEALDAPLLTVDAKLARIPGIRCEVRLLATG
ncbi:type II toxin-antitoxin system VapC family toxin [Microbacterium sp. gxy059]|uniref:type II toxin-antitoxin system VapC family toxin n=1 Tax=Microbacterium sp. gxy059 TaxID=2957199 RepID=UPI003D96FD42